MNTYLLGVIMSLFCYSPENPNLLVAQFTLYIDTNSYKDGEFNLTWESKIDKNVYRNDCEALYDLNNYREEICTPEELQGIVDRIRQMELERQLKPKKEKQIY